MIELIEEYVNRYQKWTLWRDISNKVTDFQYMLAALRESNEGDVIDIDIECEGGSCDVGYKLVQHIKESKAKVNMIVSGPCFSMGSIIAISGDSLEMKDDTFLMFHTYSTAIGKMKSGDLVNYIDHSHKREMILDEKYAKPFLTDSEVKQMHDGKDIYIWNNDKSLKQRKSRHFK